MYPVPRADLKTNTFEFESIPLVKPTGFREYDARWLFPQEINLMGIQALGMGLGTLAHEMGIRPDIITGHDFRFYSSSIKYALITGLMATGMRVKDVGLSLSPMAYYAQFALDCPAVAMVTASHNDNGWTGVKMGMNRPLTFGPDEINRLRDIILAASFALREGGAYEFVSDIQEKYIADLLNRPKLKRKLRVLTACGNGTAGAFAQRVFEAVGCEVVPLDTTPDYTFPHYNPNPEDMKMLHAIADKVVKNQCDVGLGFDGDGDRCGVVDNEGNEIFADKVGVMLARDFASQHHGATFVVDVKSTGLFATDPRLKELRVKADYWKTGHSYMKRRVNELGALAGFEKSGHFFFNKPLGRGYDDGMLTGLFVCEMLDRNPGKSMADLYRELPKTWGSPTMAPYCADEIKYSVVDRIIARFKDLDAKKEKVGGHTIVDLITVNGVRVVTDDGTWGLVRASSNKPELVVVVESPVSEQRMRDMFEAVDKVLRENPEIGEYNQKL